MVYLILFIFGLVVMLGEFLFSKRPTSWGAVFFGCLIEAVGAAIALYGFIGMLNSGMIG